MNQVIRTPQAPEPIGPYSQAVRAGQLLFLSGQIPLDPQTGHVVGETAAQQTLQVLKNIGEVLKAAALGPSHVVKSTIFLVDLADFGVVNEAYAKFFEGVEAFPARSTVQVAALPRGVHVEIEVIAHFPG